MAEKDAVFMQDFEDKSTREILLDHERRLFAMEQTQKELADSLKQMREDSAEMLKTFKEVAPVVKKTLYFLAGVGAVYLVGGDGKLLETAVTVATKLAAM
ncbi:N-myc-interactor [Vibrio phage vB_VpP_HA7]|uniref:Uncharacterized protein n=6 Tax=Maculvirus TaxID=2731958 RepID=A0A9E7NLR5_9CAUD|nr:hypothetical protein VPP93_gp39 [Vibrio phage VP93]QQM14935.1 hypothetical protein vBVcSrVc2_00045 [Vibrio phage vB_Vc_SrVc2]QXV72186.1 N-myc-interactor [Vibrio phage vB_VpP_DE10]UFK26921.1 hypothetical protein [Vibrio phage vB_VpaP_AL-1]UMW87817.1 hypothetical protein OY1_36 [Vibrio phage OY1]UTQ72417.1 hypothetical protein vBVpPAC2_43 [Vibrio phage vB_VpP_AC2]UUW39437.1 hypothetical protein vBVpaP1701_4 [Vibrio phage vB_VpaP_1701]UXF57402.1 N-myc-interactor [Vibrio phage vB_VpP_HA5]UXF